MKIERRRWLVAAVIDVFLPRFFPHHQNGHGRWGYRVGILVLVIGLTLTVDVASANPGDDMVASADVIQPANCRIPHITSLWIYCVFFLKGDVHYVALYLEGEVAIIKRLNPDGTQENVWETDKYKVWL